MEGGQGLDRIRAELGLERAQAIGGHLVSGNVNYSGHGGPSLSPMNPRSNVADSKRGVNVGIVHPMKEVRPFLTNDQGFALTRKGETFAVFGKQKHCGQTNP